MKVPSILEFLKKPDAVGKWYALIYGQFYSVKILEDSSMYMVWNKSNVALGMSECYSKIKPAITRIDLYKRTKDYWTGSIILDNIFNNKEELNNKIMKIG